MSLFAAQDEIAGYAQVATERSVDIGREGLTYAVPRALADLRVGERVVVPLGRGDRNVSGYVISRSDHSEQTKVKLILSRDPHHAALPASLVELARWMAGYYCTPLGMVISAMLPAAVKRGTGRVAQTVVQPGEGAADEAARKAAGVTKLQRAILDAAIQHEGSVEVRDLAQLAGAATIGPVRKLIDKGLLIARQHTVVRSDDFFARYVREAEPMPPVQLIEAQRQAVDRLIEQLHNGFSVHLLQGVTGSGKTEVYLRVIEAMLGRSPADASEAKGAIVLVPEIALTPQTVQRFFERFGQVAVLHSGLTAAQRHEQWQRIQHGEARIVIGARSAIFAPLPKLGLIIVDEEHDNSYKQDQLPRYHGRDVAIKRAQLAGVPVLLGSATPSLESYHNAVSRQSYHLLKLPTRATGAALPRVDIVDMSQERRKRYQMTGSAGVHLFSLRLESLIRQTLRDEGQVMLLLNRRGYANYIACPDHGCGYLMQCEHCDTTMVYHKDLRLPLGGVVRCHHCEAEQMLLRACPSCGKRITTFGLGTQRVEEELQRIAPEARAARMDSDVMRHARDYYDTLERFRLGELNVLVSTQMIAKGLDFPNVRLVGIISADTALHLPDFRAGERTFQLISQVAGRAGRASEPGVVIVQTFSPEDPVIKLAAQHDYEGFAERELVLRRSVQLPPITRMARLVVRDRDQMKCVEHAKKLFAALGTFNRDLLNESVRLRGPAPCPIARIGGYHRWQIELLAPEAATLQKLLTALRNARMLKSDAHTAVDVDPVALM